MWTAPEEDSAQASLPSAVMTIFDITLSGRLIPMRMARLRGSEINSVEACGGGAGFVFAAVLKALYSVLPSGVNTLPPTLKFVEKEVLAAAQVNGALAVFC